MMHRICSVRDFLTVQSVGVYRSLKLSVLPALWRLATCRNRVATAFGMTTSCGCVPPLVSLGYR